VGFPRYGVNGGAPPRQIPADYRIEVRGDGVPPRDLHLADLHVLTRQTLVADHHCVAGWSALGLKWSGFAVDELYERLVRPTLRPGAAVTHVAFTGLDSMRSIVRLEDVLAPGVLLADRLDGAPLTPEHGAPIRLLSPQQYGFVSTKYLCRIELYDHEPAGQYHAVSSVNRILRLVRPHERARVWREERHRFLPSWVARRVYRLVVPLPAPPLPPDADG
jgi:DMSO/TMAO reductase YedYZ molybdopterin-dependent catalytic subunit